MAKKVQVPVLGGLRKVIVPGGDTVPGTTIAEYGSGTITLAQLKAALGITTPPPNTISGTTAPASLIPGPGLAGGGVLVGPVQLNLVAPIPWMLGDDGGGGGGDGDPGPPGQDGKTGAQGPVGPAVFFLPDDTELPLDAIPGNAGPVGSTGAAGPVGPAAYLSADDGEDGWHAIPGRDGASITGAQGPIGPALFFLAEDGQDGDPGPPGVGSSSGGSATGVNITPDTHPASATAYDDEFEVGTGLDTTGSRFSGANAWSSVANGHTFAVAAGNLIITPAQVSGKIGFAYQTAPAGTWKFTAKVDFTTTLNEASGVAFVVGAGAAGKLTSFIILTESGSTAGAMGSAAQRWTNSTTLSTTVFSSFASTFAALQMAASQISPQKLVYSPVRPVYAQMEYDGTNLNFYMSASGVPGTFVKIYTETAAVWLGGAPTIIGIGCNSTSAETPLATSLVDWFRRTA